MNKTWEAASISTDTRSLTDHSAGYRAICVLVHNKFSGMVKTNGRRPSPEPYITEYTYSICKKPNLVRVTQAKRTVAIDRGRSDLLNCIGGQDFGTRSLNADDRVTQDQVRKEAHLKQFRRKRLGRQAGRPRPRRRRSTQGPRGPTVRHQEQKGGSGNLLPMCCSKGRGVSGAHSIHVKTILRKLRLGSYTLGQKLVDKIVSNFEDCSCSHTLTTRTPFQSRTRSRSQEIDSLP